MKICYLCVDRGISLAKQNGSAAHIRNMVRAFCDLGHEVELVMSSIDGAAELGVPTYEIPATNLNNYLSSDARRSDNKLLKATVKTHKRVNSALGRVWTNVIVEQVLADILQRSKPDVVYERYSPFGAAGGIAAASAGVPHVLEVNAPLAWQGAKYRDQALHEAAEFLELTAYAVTGAIRVISKELRDTLIAAGVPASKIAIVPCGVDPVEIGRASCRERV